MVDSLPKPTVVDASTGDGEKNEKMFGLLYLLIQESYKTSNCDQTEIQTILYIVKPKLRPHPYEQWKINEVTFLSSKNFVRPCKLPMKN